MIGYIEGKLDSVQEGCAYVDVQGVGYSIYIPAHYSALPFGGLVRFWTSHIVREQSQELFGFLTILEREIFELLHSVSGVGPRSALSIMSLGDAQLVARSIAQSDTAFIAGAPGIGKRSAEKICLMLKDRLPQTFFMASDHSMHDRDVVDVLETLGYTPADVRKALSTLSADSSQDFSSADTQDRIKQALKLLQ